MISKIEYTHPINAELSLVILAAGIGSRYGGMKQVEAVGPDGEFILHYSIFDALRAGFKRFFLVIRPETLPAFQKGIGERIEKVCPITYVYQGIQDLPIKFSEPLPRMKLWGTGHALWSCRSAVKTLFGVINADDFYGPESFKSMAHFLLNRQSRMDQGMIGYPIENTLSDFGTVSRAICQINQDRYLVEIQERTRIQRSGTRCSYMDENNQWIEIPQGTIVSMNFWGFSPEIFPEIERGFLHFLTSPETDLSSNEFYIPGFVNTAIKNHAVNVKVIQTSSNWFGITYPEDKTRVKQNILELHRNGVYPTPLWEGA
jgi:NDP-sugar pyrophosphorylase family protein